MMQGVLHPLFVHLHIALLFMAFVTMYYWLFKGLVTSIFENRLFGFTRFNTAAGLVFVLLSMAVGIRDGLAGYVVSFNSPLGRWLYVKASLATLILAVYSTFLWQSRKKPQFLQEDPKIMVWCLARDPRAGLAPRSGRVHPELRERRPRRKPSPPDLPIPPGRGRARPRDH